MRVIVSRFTVIALVAMVVSLAGTHAQSPSPARAWPPGVHAVADDSPARAPEDEQATFHVPPGFLVELVASEPLVQDPVAIDWDASGRLWVVEMPGYMEDITASTEHQPTGRVVVLEDVDGNGQMDRRTVFADGLVLPRSVKVLEAGVLVAEPPHLWLMHDADGDLRMDARTLVSDQYGARAIDVQNNANGLDWGLDNRVRSAGQSRVVFTWQTGTLVAGPTPVRGQWGVTHDDRGRLYRNSNESALHVSLLPDEYFARNPNLLRTRGSYERLASDVNALNVVWPVRPTAGLNRAYQAGILRADGTLARYTAACSPVVYRGDRLPGAYGHVFVADPAANLVSRLVVEDEAGAVRGRKHDAGAEFLASTDERFRPVFLANAPDGTLTVVDMYRGVIEHRLSMTQYLKGYIERRGLLTPRGLGRIWRVRHATTNRDATTPAASTPEELVALLAHPNGWRRDLAQRTIVQRAEQRLVPSLERLARDAGDDRLRLQALWTLDGLEAVTPTLARTAARDASPWVRSAALRIAERWAGDAGFDFAALASQLATDAHPAVRQQAAASLGALPDDDDTHRRIADVLAASAGDPFVVDAALSGARGAEARVLAHLAGRPAAASPLALTTVAATVFQIGNDVDARTWLERIAEARTSSWHRDALLHGAEIGLLGAPMPGQLPPLVNPTSPCATCPGGRLSAGGAYAFTDPASFARPPAPGRTLRLTRVPAGFVAFSAADTRLGKQAAAVLTRITWPGKPGDDSAPPPLTADQQARFDDGRDVYRAYCQACHEADGRGQPGRGAALVGSRRVLGPGAVPVRILLHGKEGTTGLMPPIGAALDDRQVASVLTYVRREWGQDASPIDTATVGRIRSSTKNRSRPWTDAELDALR